jgi:hypothetical protein
VLLGTPEGNIFECIQTKEHIETRYTQKDWVEAYKSLYAGAYGIYGSCFGKDEDCDEKMKKVEEENSNETRYTFQKDRVWNPALGCTSIKHCKLLEDGPEFTVLHSKWDPTRAALELLVSNDVKQSDHRIASTEYTSLLLFFEPVVFDEEEGCGLKRTRSGE